MYVVCSFKFSLFVKADLFQKKGVTMKSIEKIEFDIEELPKLKEELETLRRYLNYKNNRFCKRFLDSIIKKYLSLY